MGREGKEIGDKGEEGLDGLRELGAWRDGNPNDYGDDNDMTTVSDDGDDDDDGIAHTSSVNCTRQRDIRPHIPT